MPSKRKPVQVQLEDSLKALSRLTPEERMEIYKSLRERDRLIIGSNNGAIVFDRSIRSEDLEIKASGSIGLRSPSVFLSHSSVDKPAVKSVADHLQNNGVKVWLDEAELRFGDSLIAQLGAALDEIDLILAFLSEASVSSEWVKRELEIAMNREIANRKVVVIPVLLAPVDIPPFLRGKLYADFSNPTLQSQNMPRLVRSIQAHTFGN